MTPDEDDLPFVKTWVLFKYGHGLIQDGNLYFNLDLNRSDLHQIYSRLQNASRSQNKRIGDVVPNNYFRTPTHLVLRSRKP